MSKIHVPPRAQYLDINGDPLSGGRVSFYEAGTSTLKEIYHDPEKTIKAANPVILDAGGFVPEGGLFYGSGTYKIKVEKAITNITGNLILRTEPSNPQINGQLFIMSDTAAWIMLADSDWQIDLPDENSTAYTLKYQGYEVAYKEVKYNEPMSPIGEWVDSTPGQVRYIFEHEDYETLYTVDNIEGGGIADGNLAIRSTVVYNIDQLLSLNTETYNCAYVLGYYEPGDFGGGWFYWNTTSTDEPDFGVTFEALGTPTLGRWIRQYNENDQITSQQFGAMGVDQDQPIDSNITRMLLYANSNGRPVRFPRGVYPLQNSTRTISGASTVIIDKGATFYSDVGTTIHFTLDNLIIDHNNSICTGNCEIGSYFGVDVVNPAWDNANLDGWLRLRKLMVDVYNGSIILTDRIVINDTYQSPQVLKLGNIIFNGGSLEYNGQKHIYISTYSNPNRQENIFSGASQRLLHLINRTIRLSEWDTPLYNNSAKLINDVVLQDIYDSIIGIDSTISGKIIFDKLKMDVITYTQYRFNMESSFATQQARIKWIVEESVKLSSEGMAPGTVIQIPAGFEGSYDCFENDAGSFRFTEDVNPIWFGVVTGFSNIGSERTRNATNLVRAIKAAAASEVFLNGYNAQIVVIPSSGYDVTGIYVNFDGAASIKWKDISIRQLNIMPVDNALFTFDGTINDFVLDNVELSTTNNAKTIDFATQTHIPNVSITNCLFNGAVRGPNSDLDVSGDYVPQNKMSRFILEDNKIINGIIWFNTQNVSIRNNIISYADVGYQNKYSSWLSGHAGVIENNRTEGELVIYKPRDLRVTNNRLTNISRVDFTGKSFFRRILFTATIDVGSETAVPYPVVGLVCKDNLIEAETGITPGIVFPGIAQTKHLWKTVGHKATVEENNFWGAAKFASTKVSFVDSTRLDGNDGIGTEDQKPYQWDGSNWVEMSKIQGGWWADLYYNNGQSFDADISAQFYMLLFPNQGLYQWGRVNGSKEAIGFKSNGTYDETKPVYTCGLYHTGPSYPVVVDRSYKDEMVNGSMRTQ